MALVAHKYMPEQMSEGELEGTFAAREHTLDYLVNAIRQQMTSKKLTSYFITGARGSGKTTLVLMLELRLHRDPELSAAWLPVRFPEEAVGVTSLRDLFSRALWILTEDGIANAQDHHTAVEAEPDDARSLDLAINALREIATAQSRRLILCIENLDHVFARGLDEHAQATLRRLLMDKPFMLIVGTAVRLFEELPTVPASS